ncbi:hypothetical protein F5148DRAFT_250531 [Russula earlei]|uniref:Uncharacterized protein n=1 Tax=Russula earlei TaxID=71964 RepID=A0ACC0U487_9AGAM|nr:hypothetical protein F5148DRAFT_250531 [Russula earlei]
MSIGGGASAVSRGRPGRPPSCHSHVPPYVSVFQAIPDCPRPTKIAHRATTSRRATTGRSGCTTSPHPPYVPPSNPVIPDPQLNSSDASRRAPPHPSRCRYHVSRDATRLRLSPFPFVFPPDRSRYGAHSSTPVSFSILSVNIFFGRYADDVDSSLRSIIVYSTLSSHHLPPLTSPPHSFLYSGNAFLQSMATFPPGATLPMGLHWMRLHFRAWVCIRTPG